MIKQNIIIKIDSKKANEYVILYIKLIVLK